MLHISHLLILHYAESLLPRRISLHNQLRINTKNADNLYIHITNHAAQKKSHDYAKFENGNKMSYENFQR